MQDPSYIPDSSSGIYIIFLIIGIIGYFTVPTVAEWIVQAGGGSGLGGINRTSAFGAGVAGGVLGTFVGRSVRRGGDGGNTSGEQSGTPQGRNLATGDKR